ncbi:MAG: hypothetical protein WC854_12520 [Bacteroidales bacterium]
MKPFRDILSGFASLIILGCIIIVLGIKIIRNNTIYKANIVSLNNSNANCSAALDEFTDLLNTEFELENLNLREFELLSSRNIKITLNNIKSDSEGFFLLYFPKIMCEKCIQDQIKKVINMCSSKTNFYLIIPLVVAREIRSAYNEIGENKIFYYHGNSILITEPIKPILLHLNSEYIVDKSFVIQKINVEFNDKFLKTF